jgi:hypothetical protein
MTNQTLTVWQQITVEFNGHSLTGSYAMENGIVKVKTPFGEKADPCMCRDPRPFYLADRIA